LLLLVLLLALGACSDQSEAEAPLLRLWRDRVPVDHVPPDNVPGHGARRLASTFDGADDVAWHRVVPAPVADDGYVMLAHQPVGSVLKLGADEARAELTRMVVRAGEALSLRVSVRGRGTGGGRQVPVAALVELPRELDTSRLLRAEDIANLFDPDRHATHTLFAQLGSEFVEARLDFVVERNTTELVLYLLAPIAMPAEVAIIEHVEVVELPLGAHVANGGDFPRLTHLDSERDSSVPGAIRIALDRDMREGLLALPGSRTTWQLAPSDEPRRLEVSLGVSPRAPGPEGGVTLRIEAGGRTLLAERLTAPTDASRPAWNDRVLELPPSPDAPLELVFSAEGDGPDPPLAVFGHPTVMRARTERPPNVVLISLDTLRPDRLGCYGGTEALSPRLDALAAEGLRFDQAYSTSSYTLPSHASMLTGTYPAFHGAVDIDDTLDAKRSPFLARILRDAGYQTAAFTGGGYVSVTYGFGEGFDRYSHNDPIWALDGLRGKQLLQTMSWERVPAQVAFLTRYGTPSVVKWIEERDAGTPFFTFLHTYIVHNYAPDQESLARAGLLGEDGSEQPFNHQDRSRYNEGESGLRDTVYEQYMPYYDATIGMADDFVGQVLDALERAGLAENTIVIVTSDHGEEFGEHGFFGHGETLYSSNTLIPLIARLPDGVGAVTQPAVLDEPVSLVDLAPWILKLVGLAPDQRMAVVAPLGPTRLDPPGRDSLFVELDTRVNRLTVLRDGSRVLHRLLDGEARGFDEGDQLLFEVSTDPGETRDQSGSERDLAASMADIIDRFHALAEAVHPRGASEELDLLGMDPEILDMLIQLGYISPEDVERAGRGEER
jgi:arylsulfatase A-like enzyme